MEMVLDEVCANCSNSRLPASRVCLYCGDLLTDSRSNTLVSQAAKPLSHSAPSRPDEIHYAGFWLRVWAGAIDVCLEATAALLLTWATYNGLGRFGPGLRLSSFRSKVAAGEAFILILTVGSWLYCAFAESSWRRATVGKRLLGLQVITADGGRPSFGQATIRHLMKFLSLFCVTIGFMMSGWTKRRQALHDMPCDCLVIRVPRKSLGLLGQ